MKKWTVLALAVVVSLLAVASVASAERGDIGGIGVHSYYGTVAK